MLFVCLLLLFLFLKPHPSSHLRTAHVHSLLVICSVADVFNTQKQLEGEVRQLQGNLGSHKPVEQSPPCHTHPKQTQTTNSQVHQDVEPVDLTRGQL
jgi:hypothetical protein